MSVRSVICVSTTGAALFALAPAVQGQSIADQVDAIGDGKVRMSYAAKPGVCGNGHSGISMDGGRGWHFRRGDDEDWENDCEYGPVRVVLTVRDGDLSKVRTYVGGRWKPASGSTTDLGTVSAPEAAAYLLSVARRGEGSGEDAILPAMLADSATVWPELLEMGKDESLRQKTRKSAVFWLSQEAAEAATSGLEEIVDDGDGDYEVRKMAVFALSQRPDDEGVPALIRVAKTSRDTGIRRQALFWLGQSEDARAIALFEEILTKR